MEQLIEFIKSIDWLFAAVILIGGRYWGGKYFNITKNRAINFLAFATVFGLIWLGIQHFMEKLNRNDAGNLFITYLFVTSFYEILGQRIFEQIEKLFGRANPES